MNFKLVVVVVPVDDILGAPPGNHHTSRKTLTQHTSPITNQSPIINPPYCMYPRLLCKGINGWQIK
jgi:hypothetical protein